MPDNIPKPKDLLEAIILDFQEQYSIKRKTYNTIQHLRKIFGETFEEYIKEHKSLAVCSMTEVYYDYDKKKNEECVRLENHDFKINFRYLHTLVTRFLRDVEDSYFASQLFISIDFPTYIFRTTFSLKENQIHFIIIANKDSEKSAREIAREEYGIIFKDRSKELTHITDWSEVLIKAYKDDIKTEKKKLKENRKKIRKLKKEEQKYKNARKI